MADVNRARSVCIDVRRLGRHNCDWPIIKMVWQKVKNILKLEYSIEGLCQLCQGLSTWRTPFLNQKNQIRRLFSVRFVNGKAAYELPEDQLVEIIID